MSLRAFDPDDLPTPGEIAYDEAEHRAWVAERIRRDHLSLSTASTGSGNPPRRTADPGAACSEDPGRTSGVPGAAPSGGPTRPRAADPSCAAERPASARTPAPRSPGNLLAPPTEASSVRAARVGHHLTSGLAGRPPLVHGLADPMRRPLGSSRVSTVGEPGASSPPAPATAAAPAAVAGPSSYRTPSWLYVVLAFAAVTLIVRYMLVLSAQVSY